MDFKKCSAQDASFQAPSYPRSVPAKRLARLPALVVALGLLGVLALVVGLTSSGGRGGAVAGRATESPGGFDGAALPVARPAANFTLSDQDGHAVSLQSLRGHPVVLAFMYPGCGPTCILIAEQIRGALNELSHPAPVVIVNAAVAPASRASRQRFLEEVSLAGRALYLTGAPSALRSIWSSYSVTPASAGASKFGADAEVRLLDGAGRERVLFGPEQLSPEALAHDIGRLQQGSREGG
jgi:protein SCO1